MSKIEKLKRTLNEIAKNNVKLSLVRAIVKEVDWDAKTMTVVSLVDDLEYFDILLGLGSLYRKPKINTACLIGIYDGYNAAGFLIETEQFEELVYISATSEFVIKEAGFIVKKGNESLKDIMNDWIDEVSKIVVIQGTTINVAAMQAIKLRLNTVLSE